MEYIVLDLDTATEEQLRAAIDCNNRTYHMMTSEIAKLKKVAESTRKLTRPEIVEEEQIVVEEKSEIDNDFENEVEYYYQALKEIPEEELEDEILTALPSRKNYQYQRIMYRLKAEILRSIKEIREFLAEEGLSLEEADLEEEMALEVKRLSLIDGQLALKEETISEEVQVNNNLIFVPTTGGNIRVLDEIDHIAPEYYERFNGLFQSIIDGTFKNVQRFSNQRDLAGLFEVKDFKTRVIFKRLNKDSYAVISAFIKKTDNNKGYQNMICSRYRDYLLIEDSLKANLDNPEFMAMQQLYTEELFNRVSSSTISPVVKAKVGE